MRLALTKVLEPLRRAHNMRIIAGIYKSRTLKSMPGMDIRPTSDRLRETLFNVLCAGNSDALVGSTWIDLFAGTGAVGIEAISRGATQVYFVEKATAAARLIGENLESLKIASGFQILERDAVTALRVLERQKVSADFVFLDPPYRMTETYSQVLSLLGETSVLRSFGQVIVENEKKFDPGEGFGSFERTRKLVQGDAALSFYRRK